MSIWSRERQTQQAKQDVARALDEDLGAADLTAALIDPALGASAKIVARESAVICGCAWVEAAFLAIDPKARFTWHVKEGQRCAADQLIVEVLGQARALLSAERTALNFLQLLSAVATKTALFVQEVARVPGAKAQIVDTRKTLPGLRMAQKYAVIAGGGANHRLGLFDAVLIKENHIAAAGSISAAVTEARRSCPGLLLEVEVETLAQLKEAVEAGAQRALLDNFPVDVLREAVNGWSGRIGLEASGGVCLDSIRTIAETGVDFISVGDLTKNVAAVDFSMRFL